MTRADQHPGMRDDEAQHVGALRAEGHADANLVRALDDEKRHHTVNADRRKDERKTREDGQEHDRQFPRCDRVGDHLLKCADVRDRQGRVDRLHFAPDRAR